MFCPKNSGKNFALIFFFPLCCDLTLTRTAAVQLPLDPCLGQFNVRRATVDDHAHAAPVRFAKSRDAKELAKGVAHCVKMLNQGAKIVERF